MIIRRRVERRYGGYVRKPRFVATARGGRGGWGNLPISRPRPPDPALCKSSTPVRSGRSFSKLKLSRVSVCSASNVGKVNVYLGRQRGKAPQSRTIISNHSSRPRRCHHGRGRVFFVADIPGLIGGASDSVSLSHTNFCAMSSAAECSLHIIDAEAARAETR